jgi:hypothetical protein
MGEAISIQRQARRIYFVEPPGSRAAKGESMSEREDYEEDLREERYMRKRAKRDPWECAGPGHIRADELTGGDFDEEMLLVNRGEEQ